jgi:hypothetical protein
MAALGQQATLADATAVVEPNVWNGMTIGRFAAKTRRSRPEFGC